MSEIIFTTSWDDGHILDKKLAGLMKKYGIKGTFYIPRTYLSEKLKLSDVDVTELTKDFEIGAHTVSHRDLAGLSSEDVLSEIRDSKKWLGDLLNGEIRSFCYPRGRFNGNIKNLVIESGFKLARTVEDFKLDFEDPFEMGTTLHVYPHPGRKKDILQLRFGGDIRDKFLRARKFGIPLMNNLSWSMLAKAAFDIFLKRGGIFHLWGHSWEIEKYNMWSDLENFFIYVKKHSIGIEFKTNAELLQK